jgi:methionyl-tRNA formyltransferase
LGRLRPDLAVVVAFGQIFRRPLLELPRLGCINLHASLLPVFRGAAPIQAVIAAGITRTGVTTMQMDQGLDTGDILLQAETGIAPGETAPELSARLAELGAGLLVGTVTQLESGILTATPQDATRATHAPRLRKEDAFVDWGQTAVAIERQVRAHTPWPGTVTELGGEPLRIQSVVVVDAITPASPGTFLGLIDGGLRVACGEGSILALLRVQRPGRRAVGGQDLFNAEHLETGARFSTMEAVGWSGSS